MTHHGRRSHIQAVPPHRDDLDAIDMLVHEHPGLRADIAAACELQPVALTELEVLPTSVLASPRTPIMTPMPSLYCYAMLALLPGCATANQFTPGPVIDMHLHALPVSPENARAITEISGLSCATTDEELLTETLAALRRNGVVLALVSGDNALAWQDHAPELLWVGAQPGRETVASIRRLHQEGTYKAIAEFSPQYAGLAPGDPSLEPFFALAEELDLPVGYHMGLGPPGAAYTVAPEYRMSLSNPLLFEEVLLRHPNLRLFVMHAGWPMLDEMLGLLHAHPQVYVDIGVIDWALPEKEFHHYLSRLVGAGFGDRVLFGSDQMDSPAAIGVAIRRIRDADYLSAEQERAILYDNAARFLRLSDEEIALHHESLSR